MKLFLILRRFDAVFLEKTVLYHSVAVLLLYVGCFGVQLDIKLSLPNEGGGREFRYFEEKITWNEAATFCQNEGGSLAKVDSNDFHVRLVNAFEAVYGTNPFAEDYWIGVFQPSEGDFRWASDCSTAYYTSHLEKTWDSNRMCFKIDKSQHIGSHEPCDADRAFMCEVPLPSAYSCNTGEIFSANSLGTEVSVLADCEISCELDQDCWMILFTPPFNCVKLAYNTEVPAAGVVAEKSPVVISGKFCIEVYINTTAIVPIPADSSKIPIINCSAPAVTSTPTVFTTLPPITPTPTPICATQTVFSVSVSSCLPQTMTENIYHTIDCATETLTIVPTPSCGVATETLTISPSPSCPVAVETLSIMPSCAVVTETRTILPTPSCSAEISTIIESASCVSSPCDCTPTVSTLTVAPFCPSIAPTSTTITTSSSITAEELAEEIAQNLTVDEKSTSAYKRKLTSARDDRPMSKTMGYLGICFVIIPLAFIVLMDIKRMVLHATRNQMYHPDKKHPPMNRFVDIWKQK